MALAARPFHANHAPFLDAGSDDPLARALQPPPDESPDQRELREQMQREASRISSEIDDDIQEARKVYERRKKAIKILLLGESSRVVGFALVLVCNLGVGGRVEQKSSRK